MSKKKEKLLKKYLDKKRKQRKRDDLIAQIAEIDKKKGPVMKEIKKKERKRRIEKKSLEGMSEVEVEETRIEENSSGEMSEVEVNYKEVKNNSEEMSEVEVEGNSSEDSIMSEVEESRIGIKMVKEVEMSEESQKNKIHLKNFNPVRRSEEIQMAREKLPIYYEQSEIVSLIRNNPVVLIKGPTGCGKTTQIPQFLYESGFSQIGVTQPRRISTIGICSRINEELGEDLCGYKIRYDSNVKASHKIVTMTDGILLKEVQEDFLLERYSVIILDEIHERSCNLDILISLMVKIVKLRKEKGNELKLILMTASDLGEGFEFPTYEIPTNTHKLSIFYDDGPISRDSHLTKALERIKRIFKDMKKKESTTSSSILVFLPSKSDIYRLKDMLEKEVEATVLPLHSSLSKKEQSLVYKKFHKKIILSTNIAETSITIPDVVFVLDSGLVKNKYVTPEGIVQYKTEFISKSSALQRAGRAGRTCPGICYRLYSGEAYSSFLDQDPPKIQYEPLDSIVLDLISLGIPCINKFPFLSTPPEENLKLAFSNLKRLGILDKEEKLTQTGRIISKLPISPKLARLLCIPQTSHLLPFLIALVSCLSVNFELKRNKETETFFTSEKSDVIVMLKIFLEFKKKGKKFNCLGINNSTLSEALKMNSFLLKKFSLSETTLELGEEEKKSLREIFFKVYSDNLAVPNTDSYFFKGLNVHLFSSSVKTDDEFVVFEFLSQGSKRIYMKNVTVVDKEWFT